MAAVAPPVLAQLLELAARQGAGDLTTVTELPWEEHTLMGRRLPGSTADDAMAREPHDNAMAMEEVHEGPLEGPHDVPLEGLRGSFRSGGTISRMLGGSVEGRGAYDEQYREGGETGFETGFDEEYAGAHSGGRQLLRRSHKTHDGHYRKKVT